MYISPIIFLRLLASPNSHRRVRMIVKKEKDYKRTTTLAIATHNNPHHTVVATYRLLNCKQIRQDYFQRLRSHRHSSIHKSRSVDSMSRCYCYCCYYLNCLLSLGRNVPVKSYHLHYYCPRFIFPTHYFSIIHPDIT